MDSEKLRKKKNLGITIQGFLHVSVDLIIQQGMVSDLFLHQINPLRFSKAVTFLWFGVTISLPILLSSR